MRVPQTDRSKKRSYSFTSRVTLWFGLNLLIAGAIIATAAHAELKQFMLGEAVIDMNNRIEALTFTLQRPGSLERLMPQIENGWQARRGELAYLRVLNGKGAVIVASSEIKQQKLTPLFKIKNDTKKPVVRVLNGQSYLVFTTHIRTHDPTLKNATFQFATDLSQHQKLLNHYYKLFWIIFLVTGVFSVLWSWYLSRSAFVPLRSVIARIRKWQTALHDRLPSDHLPQELVELIQTFNAMLEKIEDAFDRLSRFSADIAHELKAPIMNITSSTEIQLSRPRTTEEYREALFSNLEEMRRIAEIVERLLFVAKAESPDQNLRIESVKVRDTVEKLVEFFQGLADEKRVQLKVEIEPTLQLFAERTLLEHAISNLLSNAIKYSPQGGSVLVSARQTRDNIVITVTDEGAGIPPEDLPFVFDRFYRGKGVLKNGPVTGHGLGLTIVKSIMNLHKGRATIVSQPDNGTSATLEFSLEIQRKFGSGASVAENTANFSPYT